MTHDTFTVQCIIEDLQKENDNKIAQDSTFIYIWPMGRFLTKVIWLKYTSLWLRMPFFAAGYLAVASKQW